MKMKSWGKNLFRYWVVGVSTALVFGVAILTMSFLAASNPDRVYPMEPSTVKVEYYLAYPGMLPDSPFYPLKALRDRVALWLTFGQERKAWKMIALADKRINAALFLVEGGKVNLGVSVAGKAERYLTQSVDNAEAEQKNGKDVKSLLFTLEKSLSKHTEILNGLSAKGGDSDKKNLESTLKVTNLAAERVRQLILEAK